MFMPGCINFWLGQKCRFWTKFSQDDDIQLYILECAVNQLCQIRHKERGERVLKYDCSRRNFTVITDRGKQAGKINIFRVHTRKTRKIGPLKYLYVNSCHVDFMSKWTSEQRQGIHPSCKSVPGQITDSLVWMNENSKTNYIIGHTLFTRNHKRDILLPLDCHSPTRILSL